ncbi:hypothetical protein [Acetobacter malorum]|uniref:hypothetical protein n=1 Tax=Acetobacter malorum TaxID=178901 RepID=UPI0012E9531E|nr:hypothetical protein [Acetobacter malorum]
MEHILFGGCGALLAAGVLVIRAGIIRGDRQIRLNGMTMLAASGLSFAGGLVVLLAE